MSSRVSGRDLGLCVWLGLVGIRLFISAVTGWSNWCCVESVGLVDDHEDAATLLELVEHFGEVGFTLWQWCVEDFVAVAGQGAGMMFSFVAV